MGFNAISRVLKVSDIAVLKWIRKYEKEVTDLQNNNRVNTIEMDELHICKFERNSC